MGILAFVDTQEYIGDARRAAPETPTGESQNVAENAPLDPLAEPVLQISQILFKFGKSLIELCGCILRPDPRTRHRIRHASVAVERAGAEPPRLFPVIRIAPPDVALARQTSSPGSLRPNALGAFGDGCVFGKNCVRKYEAMPPNYIVDNLSANAVNPSYRHQDVAIDDNVHVPRLRRSRRESAISAMVPP